MRPASGPPILFTVQTLTFRTLYVLIVIDHGRRRIPHWNVTEHPIAPWIWRQTIEATARGQQPGFLIRDRDRSDGGDFIARARRIGIETILTPLRAPNANAIAERVIRDAPARVPRSRHRRQRTASETGAWSVRPALQRDAAASVIGARLSGATQAAAADAEPASRQQAGARRLASSVSVGRMRFCRPTTGTRVRTSATTVLTHSRGPRELHRGSGWRKVPVQRPLASCRCRASAMNSATLIGEIPLSGA